MKRPVTFRDASLLTHTVWALIKLALLQPRLPLPALVKRFDVPPRGDRDLDLDRTSRFTRRLLKRLFVSHFCMQRSIVLFYLLKRASYDPVFRIGVASIDGKLVAHAWVDVDGNPFGEARDPRSTYRLMYSYPEVPQAPALQLS